MTQQQTTPVRRIIGPTILLGSGTYFDFDNPEASEPTIEDADFAEMKPSQQTTLQVTNPATIAQFVSALGDHGVKLPLLPMEDDVGTLMDANRSPVLVVDVNRERSDEDVAWIVGMIQVAVNTCGGFKAQRREVLDE